MAERKDLKRQYQNRDKIGGVFAVKNIMLDRWYIDHAVDIRAAQNRFSMFGGGTYAKTKNDFAQQQGQGFAFEILEELAKPDNQSDSSFRNDLAALKDMWLEKLTQQKLY